MSKKYDKRNWRTNKIITPQHASVLAEVHRTHKGTLVTLNGSFDILHAGHLDQLEEAKKQGSVLFVGVNSDRSVREGKGPGRPFIDEQARAALLAALECVDYVLILSELYNGGVPKALLETIKPDVHVNGADYGPPETWLEWPVMQKFGTRGYVVEHRNPISTTALVAKILKTHPLG